MRIVVSDQRNLSLPGEEEQVRAIVQVALAVAQRHYGSVRFASRVGWDRSVTELQVELRAEAEARSPEDLARAQDLVRRALDDLVEVTLRYLEIGQVVTALNGHR